MQYSRVRDLFFVLIAISAFQPAQADIEYLLSGNTGGIDAYANKLMSYDTVTGHFAVVGPFSDQSLQPNFNIVSTPYYDISKNTITFRICAYDGAICGGPKPTQAETIITIDAATGHTLSAVPMDEANALLPSGTWCCYAGGTPIVSATTLTNVQTGISNNTASINTNTASISAINKYHQVNSTGAAASATGANSIAVGDGANASGSGATAIGHNASATRPNSVALGANSVADEDNTVSVGSTGNARRITNVAAGVHSTDAVNVDQLQTGLAQVLSQANAYTDHQVSGLRDYMNRRANGGAAAAMALGGIPQPVGDGKVMIGVGYGNWRGAQGVAVGGAAIVGSRTVVKAGATFDDQGGKGFSGGIGLQF